MQSLACRSPANYKDIYKHKWGRVKKSLRACVWLTNELKEDDHGSLNGCPWPNESGLRTPKASPWPTSPSLPPLLLASVHPYSRCSKAPHLAAKHRVSLPALFLTTARVFLGSTFPGEVTCVDPYIHPFPSARAVRDGPVRAAGHEEVRVVWVPVHTRHIPVANKNLQALVC